MSNYFEQRISDRQQILETVASIGQLQDQRQWEKLEQYLSENLYYDQQEVNGELPTIISKKGLISRWKSELAAYYYATKHMIDKIVVKVNGTKAKVTSKVSDTHFVSEKGERFAWTINGQWEYDMVKRSGRWKVAKMCFTLNNQAVRPIGV
jgi:SnoaL-like domain